MSHVASIAIILNNLDALELACRDCGLILNRNKANWTWYGSWQADYSAEDAAYKHGLKPEFYGRCASHTISIPGSSNSYEIGVYKIGEGPLKDVAGEGYQLVWDFYAGGHGLQTHLGGPKDCNKLMDAYSKHVAIKQAISMGLTVQEEIEEDGTINLTLYDYA